MEVVELTLFTKVHNTIEISQETDPEMDILLTGVY
jgi:hypothetical protein